jgi:hypothetical protein
VQNPDESTQYFIQARGLAAPDDDLNKYLKTEKMMKYLKAALLISAIHFVLTGFAIAQEQAPMIYLETSEKCNNYARHYCQNGGHEAAVNRALLHMKKKGYRITAKVIISLAGNTPARSRNPVTVTAE